MTRLAPRETLIAEGSVAPDFSLPDQDRNIWTLSQALESGDVVLCFFPFAFSGTCGSEMTCLQDEQELWVGAGLNVIGLSCDSPHALRAWATHQRYSHPMLSDLHREVCRAYGLYWPEKNVSQRGTVIITRDSSGVPTVKWAQARPPGEAMDFDEVMTHAREAHT